MWGGGKCAKSRVRVPWEGGVSCAKERAVCKRVRWGVHGALGRCAKGRAMSIQTGAQRASIPRGVQRASQRVCKELYKGHPNGCAKSIPRGVQRGMESHTGRSLQRAPKEARSRSEGVCTRTCRVAPLALHKCYLTVVQAQVSCSHKQVCV